MRVCIFARSCPGSWVDHYIAAFRRHADVLVVGEPPDASALADWGRADLGRCEQVDVPCDFSQPFELKTILPRGWEPDLAVGISGLGGAPMYQGVPTLTCPTAYVTVDTWQCLYDYSDARGYDFVFAAQREFIPHLHATGSHRVEWLPLACDPDAHHPVECAVTHDIAFAGSASRPVHRARRALLDALATRFSLLAREGVFGDALNETFARGALAFNHCAVREVNMRVFEALAMGRPLLTNAEAAANGLFDLFQDGREIAVYESPSDLMERAATLLAQPRERERMAREGREKVLNQHTYDHRVKTILDTVARHQPSAHERRAAEAYRGPRLRDYLPYAPGVVADYGLGLRTSRVRLRRRGVEQFIGIALDGDVSRQASYDTFITAPNKDLRVDTVALETRGRERGFLESALPAAWDMLVPGGNLVLALDARTRTGIGSDTGAWLRRNGFHPRLESLPLEDGAIILAGRKRTRPLRSIVRRLFGELQIPDVDVPALCARIPDDW